MKMFTKKILYLFTISLFINLNIIPSPSLSKSSPKEMAEVVNFLEGKFPEIAIKEELSNDAWFKKFGISFLSKKYFSNTAWLLGALGTVGTGVGIYYSVDGNCPRNLDRGLIGGGLTTFAIALIHAYFAANRGFTPEKIFAGINFLLENIENKIEEMDTSYTGAKDEFKEVCQIWSNINKIYNLYQLTLRVSKNDSQKEFFLNQQDNIYTRITDGLNSSTSYLNEVLIPEAIKAIELKEANFEEQLSVMFFDSDYPMVKAVNHFQDFYKIVNEAIEKANESMAVVKQLKDNETIEEIIYAKEGLTELRMRIQELCSSIKSNTRYTTEKHELAEDEKEMNEKRLKEEEARIKNELALAQKMTELEKQRAEREKVVLLRKSIEKPVQPINPQPNVTVNINQKADAKETEVAAKETKQNESWASNSKHLP